PPQRRTRPAPPALLASCRSTRCARGPRGGRRPTRRGRSSLLVATGRAGGAAGTRRRPRPRPPRAGVRQSTPVAHPPQQRERGVPVENPLGGRLVGGSTLPIVSSAPDLAALQSSGGFQARSSR